MSRHFGPADLPDTLPVFPLDEALLLPRGRLPLNVFEPRYLAMFEDALKTPHRLIGMIQTAGARSAGDDGGDPPLRKVGCAGRIVSFSETEDGRYLIVLSGVSRFSPMTELDGFTPYRRVQPDWSSFAGDLGPPKRLFGGDDVADPQLVSPHRATQQVPQPIPGAATGSSSRSDRPTDRATK